MVADVVRRIAVRDLPHQLATIEVDGREDSVRRLGDRESLYCEAAAAGRRRIGGRAGRGRRCCRRRRPGRRIRGAAVAWTEHLAELLTAETRNVADIRESRWRLDERSRRRRVARLRV